MFRTAMTVLAAYAFGFGVAALLAPDHVYSLFGSSIDDEFTRTLARDHAGLAAGLGVIAWLARGIERGEARRAVGTGSAVALLLVGASVALGTANGAANSLAWGIVVSHFALAAWILYAQADRPATLASRA